LYVIVSSMIVIWSSRPCMFADMCSKSDEEW
jgi:hypothetical protein